MPSRIMHVRVEDGIPKNWKTSNGLNENRFHWSGDDWVQVQTECLKWSWEALNRREVVKKTKVASYI